MLQLHAWQALTPSSCHKMHNICSKVHNIFSRKATFMNYMLLQQLCTNDSHIPWNCNEHLHLKILDYLPQRSLTATSYRGAGCQTTPRKWQERWWRPAAGWTTRWTKCQAGCTASCQKGWRRAPSWSERGSSFSTSWMTRLSRWQEEAHAYTSWPRVALVSVTKEPSSRELDHGASLWLWRVDTRTKHADIAHLGGVVSYNWTEFMIWVGVGELHTWSVLVADVLCLKEASCRGQRCQQWNKNNWTQQVVLLSGENPETPQLSDTNTCRQKDKHTVRSICSTATRLLLFPVLIIVI